MHSRRQLLISLVIPCYNEAERIEPGLHTALDYLQKQKYSWEIIIVDDGSSDTTVAKAEKLLQGQPHILLKHTKNSGKGAALRTGVLAAGGKYIFFSDIDFSTPMGELPKLLTALSTHALAIGVRRHPKSRVLRHQPKLRELLGDGFTRLTNIIVVPGIYDVTCGFKGFRRTSGQDIFKKGKLDRWAFDAELLFLARKYHYRIAQIPVIWINNPATKVHLVRDGAYAFFDLIKIRIWNSLGLYG